MRSLGIVQQAAAELVFAGADRRDLTPMVDSAAVVGGADMLLWAVVGPWFGLRWVWPVAGAAVIALGLAALVQLAARSAGWRMPWAADHLPVVPVMCIVLATAS